VQLSDTPSFFKWERPAMVRRALYQSRMVNMSLPVPESLDILDSQPVEQPSRPLLIRVLDDLRQCQRRYADALQRKHVAQVRGDLVGADQALCEQWEAGAEAEQCRQVIAQAGLCLLRHAVEENPRAVRELLADVFCELLAAELPAAMQAVRKGGRR
jgi:hypothetical protein